MGKANLSWKKLNVENKNLEGLGFLGLEEVDPSEYGDSIVIGSSSSSKSTTPTKNKTNKKDNNVNNNNKSNINNKNNNKNNDSNNEKISKPLKKKLKKSSFSLEGSTDIAAEMAKDFVEGQTIKKPKLTSRQKRKNNKTNSYEKMLTINDNSDVEDDGSNDQLKSLYPELAKKNNKNNNKKQKKDDQKKPDNKQVEEKEKDNKKEEETTTTDTTSTTKTTASNNNKKKQKQKQQQQQEKDQDQQENNETKVENDKKEGDEESTTTTKKVKPKKVKTKAELEKAQRNLEKIEKIKKRKEASLQKTLSEEDQSKLDLSEWAEYNLDPLITKGLKSLGFSKPTQIQSEVIPTAITKGYDIIGAAETGSGKTLAFGIPIINRILIHFRKHGIPVEKKEEQGSNSEKMNEDKEEVEEEEVEEQEEIKVDNSFRKLYALVICPTRELAIQVTNHLKSIANQTCLKVVSIVGGMATERQERILLKRPEIVVGTPGRLWELMSTNIHLMDLSSLFCLAIDEADRMIEKGHFEELDSILGALPTVKVQLSKKEKLKLKQEYKQKQQKKRKNKQIQSEEDDQENEEEEEEELEEEEEQVEEEKNQTKFKRQTFVFSATLVGIPQISSKPHQNAGPAKNQKTPIESLIEKVRFQREYKLIDCTMSRLTAKNLRETKILCNLEDKDNYLYYFIDRYPGRTLVFVNTIDCARRLIPILNNLNVPAYPLHAQMQQKQRLKNLDRFRTLSNVVLIATDVAARGLDIPLVQHVIHYQIPRTAELYIHRSGRTARSNQEGISVLLVSPKERNTFYSLDQALEQDIENFPIDLRYMSGIQERLSLALEIDKLSHQDSKTKRDKNWFQKAAADMDIEFDQKFLGFDDSESEDEAMVKQKKKKQDINILRQRLQQLLSHSLLPRGSSTRYITTSSLAELENKSKTVATVDFDNKLKRKRNNFKSK
eukprot:gene8029-9875_t